MRILVLCDDHWHPAHVARDGLDKLADGGLAFDVIADAGGLQPWHPDQSHL